MGKVAKRYIRALGLSSDNISCPCVCCFASASAAPASPSRASLALLANRRRGLRRRLGLRADIHARYTHLTIEARERVNHVGEAQLFPNPLEQPARHTAPGYVAEHQQGVLAAVGGRYSAGGGYDVRLGGGLDVAGFVAANRP